MQTHRDEHKNKHRETQKAMLKTLKATGTALLATTIAFGGVSPSIIPLAPKTMVAHAANAETDFTYTTDATTNEVTITGYTGASTIVAIPDTLGGNPVTAIGDNAFKGKTTITSVTLGANVKTIGSYSFSGMTGLTTLTLDANLETIGDYAFYNNTKIATVDMSGTQVKTIGVSAFQGNSLLTTLKLSPSLTDIGALAFSGDARITTLDLTTTPNLKTIGDSAFFNATTLATIKFDSALESIGAQAFKGTKPTTLDFSTATNLKSIGDNAFQAITTLTSVTLNDDLETIGNYAFQGDSGLTAIAFKGKLKSIGDYAFANDTKIATADFSNASGLQTIGKYAFQSNTAITSLDLSGATNLETIDDYAFLSNTGVTSITLNTGLTTLGKFSFAGLIKLPAIDLSQLSDLKAIGDYAFQNDTSLASVKFNSNLEQIGIGSFTGNTALTGVDFNQLPNLTTIKDSAFYNDGSLILGDLPNSLTTIGTLAFYNIKGVANDTFVLPPNLTFIGAQAFQNITTLKKVVFNDKIDSIEASTFANDTALTDLDFSNAKNLTKIKQYAFDSDSALILDVSSLPSSLTYLSGFSKIKGIKDNVLVIPDNVKTIGWGAFSYSTLYTVNEIRLNSNTEVIEPRAFCIDVGSTLKNLYIPTDSKLTTIGDYAFSGTNIVSLILPSHVTTVGNNAFTNNFSLTQITLNEGLQYIGDFAFQDTKPTSIVIPSSVSVLGTQAFLQASGYTLQKVVVLSKYMTYRGNTKYFEGNPNVAIYGYIGSTTYNQYFNKGFLPLDDNSSSTVLLPTIASNITNGTTYKGQVNPTFNVTNSNTTTYTLDGNTYDGVTPITTSGSHTLTVTATNDFTSVSKTYNFSLTADNLPTVTKQIGDQTIPTNSTLQLDLTQYFADADNDNLTYEVTTSDTHDSQIWTTADGILKFRALSDGTYKVTVKAYDGGGYSEVMKFNVTTTASNTGSGSGTGSGTDTGTGSGSGTDTGTTTPSTPKENSTMQNVNIDTLLTDYKVNVKPLFKDVDLTNATFKVENSDNTAVSNTYDEPTGVLTLQGLVKGFSTVSVTATDNKGNKSNVTFLVYVNPVTQGTTTTITADSMSISDTTITKGEQLYTVSMTTVFGNVINVSDIKNYVITLVDTSTGSSTVVQTASLKPLSLMSYAPKLKLMSTPSPSLLDGIMSDLPSSVPVQGTASSTNVKASIINNQLILEGVHTGITQVSLQAISKTGDVTSPVKFNLKVMTFNDGDSSSNGSTTGGSDNSGSTGGSTGYDNSGSIGGSTGSDNSGSTGGSVGSGNGSGTGTGSGTGSSQDQQTKMNSFKNFVKLFLGSKHKTN